MKVITCILLGLCLEIFSGGSEAKEIREPKDVEELRDIKEGNTEIQEHKKTQLDGFKEDIKNDHFLICILTHGCKNDETHALESTTAKPNRVKRKGGRGGGGFGGFRGASAGRAASGARFSSSGKSGSASRGSYGAGGTYLYAGGGNRGNGGSHETSVGDVIFVLLLLTGVGIALVIFCSHISKEDKPENRNIFVPPRRYPHPPPQQQQRKQKTTAARMDNKKYQQQCPPPVYEEKETKILRAFGSNGFE